MQHKALAGGTGSGSGHEGGEACRPAKDQVSSKHQGLL